MSEKVFLSAADRQLEFYVRDGTFDRSLFLNFLFQPGFVIPDIYFVISSGIAAHVSQSERSLLEASIESGIGIPAFRDSECASFEYLLEMVKGIQGIRQDTAEQVVHRLWAAEQKNPKFSPIIWPENVGLEYRELIVRQLCGDDPPLVDETDGITQERVDELWKSTRMWRITCFGKACEYREKEGGADVRRGDILNAAGEMLDFPGGHVVDDIEELFTKGTFKSHDDYMALNVYLRWINELYQHNLATQLKVRKNITQYDPVSVLVGGDGLGMNPDRLLPSQDSTIFETVPFASDHYLKRIRASELLSIREDIGAAYFAALQCWQEDPTDGEKEGELRRTLREYTNAVVLEVKGAGNPIDSHLEAIVGSRRPAVKRLVNDIQLGGIALATYLEPTTGLLIAAGKIGYSVYRLRKDRPTKETIRLQANSGPLPAEVSVDVRHGDEDEGV